MSDVVQEVAEMLFGAGADELIAKMNPTSSDLSAAQKQKSDRKQRAITTGLSVIGGSAGAYGLGYAGRDIHRSRKLAAAKGLPKPKPGKAALGMLALEGIGLGGDVMATRLLGGDVRRAQKLKKVEPAKPAKQGNLVKKDLGELKNQARVPTKGSLTRAVVTSPRARKKGLEYTKKGAGMLRRLPDKTLTTNTVEKSGASRGDDEIDVIWNAEIAKADSDKQQIFGWASVVELNGEPVVDLQGDYISAEEMEKAGYEYVMKSRAGGDMHLRDDWKPIKKSEMIESFIVTPEKREAMGLPDSVPTGWWVGYQVQDPEVWAKIKSGERTGFSIHGRGKRTPL